MAPDALLAKVETFLRRTGEPPTNFGTRVANDPALVFKMRKKRQLRYELEQAVLEGMK